MTLRAPFPWFGGKSRVAPLVWERFGPVRNYVEPFAGSLAVLLGRPGEPGIEIVNDWDCYLANYWRAIQQAPQEVARWADAPVNEADLHARHQWLVDQEAFRERMLSDPDFFDVRIAGWWLWGLTNWIGSGWCCARARVSRQLPRLSKAASLGRGGEARRGQMLALAARLESVRVVCGGWQRVLSPAVLFQGSGAVAGVFLDPPYDAGAGRTASLYAVDDSLQTDPVGREPGKRPISHWVRRWAIENGDNPRLRIAVCGYEGEHEFPETWDCVPWKAVGGYGLQSAGRGRENRGRERIWFSPHCLPPLRLFGGG